LAPSLINNQKSFLYENSFDELCGWLKDLLKTGALISLITVQEKYQEFLQSRNETITEAILRTTSIRDRLNTKFREKILFTKVNNLQGIYIFVGITYRISHNSY
jgi:hypothetical protein